MNRLEPTYQYYAGYLLTKYFYHGWYSDDFFKYKWSFESERISLIAFYLPKNDTFDKSSYSESYLYVNTETGLRYLSDFKTFHPCENYKKTFVKFLANAILHRTDRIEATNENGDIVVDLAFRDSLDMDHESIRSDFLSGIKMGLVRMHRSSLHRNDDINYED